VAFADSKVLGARAALGRRAASGRREGARTPRRCTDCAGALARWSASDVAAGLFSSGLALFEG
jgi:hypothetical protein